MAQLVFVTRLRSWIGRAGAGGWSAQVPVSEGERDPQRFWVAVADALHGTVRGSALVRPLTAAPDLDGWAIVERLLNDLARLADRVWLVIDDVRISHQVGTAAGTGNGHDVRPRRQHPCQREVSRPQPIFSPVSSGVSSGDGALVGRAPSADAVAGRPSTAPDRPESAPGSAGA
jgi:hypothetical protein